MFAGCPRFHIFAVGLIDLVGTASWVSKGLYWDCQFNKVFLLSLKVWERREAVTWALLLFKSLACHTITVHAATASVAAAMIPNVLYKAVTVRNNSRNPLSEVMKLRMLDLLQRNELSHSLRSLLQCTDPRKPKKNKTPCCLQLYMFLGVDWICRGRLTCQQKQARNPTGRKEKYKTSATKTKILPKIKIDETRAGDKKNQIRDRRQPTKAR